MATAGQCSYCRYRIFPQHAQQGLKNASISQASPGSWPPEAENRSGLVTKRPGALAALARVLPGACFQSRSGPACPLAGELLPDSLAYANWANLVRREAAPAKEEADYPACFSHVPVPSDLKIVIERAGRGIIPAARRLLACTRTATAPASLPPCAACTFALGRCAAPCHLSTMAYLHRVGLLLLLAAACQAQTKSGACCSCRPRMPQAADGAAAPGWRARSRRDSTCSPCPAPCPANDLALCRYLQRRACWHRKRPSLTGQPSARLPAWWGGIRQRLCASGLASSAMARATSLRCEPWGGAHTWVCMPCLQICPQVSLQAPCVCCF